MEKTSPTPAARKPEARSRVTNGKDILPNIDGRSLLARRMRDIRDAIIADQGGEEAISEVRRNYIKRFSFLSARTELAEAGYINSDGKIDDVAYNLSVSTMVRVGSRIGIDRRSRDITPALKDYFDDEA
jgi:hypothetical protein